MRMDRYEDETQENNSKQTRTNKNQELYTDVYLNNVYLDVNDLKDVVYENNEQKEEVNKTKEEFINNYTYEDKVYDINNLVKDAIKNKKDDNLKRSLDKRVDDLDLKNLIESINETKEQKADLKVKEEHEINEQSDNLLTDLLPENKDTIMMEPLAEPILDKEDLDTLALKEKTDFKENLDNNLLEERDESFLIENDKNHKVIWIILGVILVISLIIVLVLWNFGIFK